MRAKNLREKYFEQYIIFENILRQIARLKIDLYKTKNKSVYTIIVDLGKVNSKRNLKIPISELKIHHKIRNWLAHQPSNSKCPIKYLNKMKEIKNFNAILLKIMQKK